MYYQVKQDGKTVYESYEYEDCEDFIQFENIENAYITEFIPCRSCRDKEGHLRHDTDGIPTGYFCDECFETNYPYRKDAYHDYLNAGEYLDEY